MPETISTALNTIPTTIPHFLINTKSKKNSNQILVESLQNDSNQILNTPKDKLEIAECFYLKLYSSTVIEKTVQNQFFQRVPTVATADQYLNCKILQWGTLLQPSPNFSEDYVIPSLQLNKDQKKKVFTAVWDDIRPEFVGFTRAG